MPHCKNCNDHFEKIRRCGVKTSKSLSNELGFSVVGYQSAEAMFLKEGTVGYASNESNIILIIQIINTTLPINQCNITHLLFIV